MLSRMLPVPASKDTSVPATTVASAMPVAAFMRTALSWLFTTLPALIAILPATDSTSTVPAVVEICTVVLLNPTLTPAEPRTVILPLPLDTLALSLRVPPSASSKTLPLPLALTDGVAGAALVRVKLPLVTSSTRLPFALLTKPASVDSTTNTAAALCCTCSMLTDTLPTVSVWLLIR